MLLRLLTRSTLFFSALFALMIFLNFEVRAGDNINVSGYGPARSKYPFIDENGDPYGTSLVYNPPTWVLTLGWYLQEDSLFGPNGPVGCSVNLMLPVDYVDEGLLVDSQGNLLIDVFIAGSTRQDMSSEEINELERFVANGGILYLNGLSEYGYGVPFNSLLERFGFTERFSETWTGIVHANYSTFPNVSPIVDGVFLVDRNFRVRGYRAIDPFDTANGVVNDPITGALLLAENEYGKGYVVMAATNMHVDGYTRYVQNRNYFLNMFAMGCREEEQAVVLDVPSLKQYDAQWASYEYDTASMQNLGCGENIRECGCALTSAAMVMQSQGIHDVGNSQTPDPDVLNTWFSEEAVSDEEGRTVSRGYLFGRFNWRAVGPYTKDFYSENGDTKLQSKEREDFDEQKVREYIDEEVPVIVKVFSEEVDEHWVVVRGYDDVGLIINDPAWPDAAEGYVYLSDRYTAFSQDSMVHYDKVHSDYRMLDIVTVGNVLIEVFDARGERMGNSYHDEVYGNPYEDNKNDNYGTNVVELNFPEDGYYDLKFKFDEDDEDDDCSFAIYASDTKGNSEHQLIDECEDMRVYFDDDGDELLKIGEDEDDDDEDDDDDDEEDEDDDDENDEDEERERRVIDYFWKKWIWRWDE